MTTGIFPSLLMRTILPAFALVVWSTLPLMAQSAKPNSKTILHFDRESQKSVPAESDPGLHHDPSVLIASHSSPSTSRPPAPASANRHPHDPRKLAPPSTPSAGNLGPAIERRSLSAATADLLQPESLSTAAAGLAVVLGLFLACMWLSRKTGPRSTTALPGDAVGVLGRVTLAPRHSAQLLQVGNKLVLISLTPEGATPLTEVTDPDEVQRLLGMCLRNHKQSTTAQFQHVLDKLAREPARGFLGEEGTR